MPFAQKVKSALRAIVDIMALHSDRFVKNPGKDFSRERKLGFVQMIRLCICMESGCICHELLKYFFFNPDESPSASAFIQQRAKLLHDAFYHLHAAPGNAAGLISQHILPVRPDRTYARQLRFQVPASFAYRFV